MDRVILCANHIPLVTSIHNDFIEKYMPQANGSYVKVYLYLAKCMQHGEKKLSISCLADRMENTEGDVLRALAYWEKQGLLILDRDPDSEEITGIDMLFPEDLGGEMVPASTAAVVSEAERQQMTEAGSPIGADMPDMDDGAEQPAREEIPDSMDMYSQPGQDEDTDRLAKVPAAATKRDLSDDPEYAFLLPAVEQYMQRPLYPGEISLLEYLYVDLDFSAELILHLYEYCIGLDKTAPAYIRKVALNWHEKGVQTVEEAKREAVEYSRIYQVISKAFGFGRPLAEAEMKIADRWVRDYGYSEDMIKEACGRTMLHIHKADFKYTEGILKNWKNSNIIDIDDIRRSDEAHMANAGRTPGKPSGSPRAKKSAQNSFQQFDQRERTSKEMSDLEKRLRNKSMSS